jgi:hypothetical protein
LIDKKVTGRPFNHRIKGREKIQKKLRKSNCKKSKQKRLFWRGPVRFITCQLGIYISNIYIYIVVFFNISNPKPIYLLLSCHLIAYNIWQVHSLVFKSYTWMKVGLYSYMEPTSKEINLNWFLKKLNCLHINKNI